MIIFFHFLCLLARYIVVNISNSLRQRKEISDDSNEDEALKNLSRSYLHNVKDMKPPIYQNKTLRFFPPIYVQRYETVALILQNFSAEGTVRKVVDFGCSELGLLPYLKNIETIHEILEVDINEELLRRVAFKAAPLTSDYLMSKESRPLDVLLLAGNVADYDDHLAGCDTVICIELIEHLPDETFSKMPFNIFHRIKPKVAIFTTPNADFNSLFPDFEGMRHEDHKFEWSRKEFYIWTQNIISRYQDYSVRFYGVGAGPEGTENLGCCSQVAVFTRSDDIDTFASARDGPEGAPKYRLIEHFKYPFFVDTRSVEEKVVHEIQYQVAYLSTLPTYYNYEDNETELPVTLLLEYVRDLCRSEDELLEILKSNGYELRRNEDSWYLIAKESEMNSSDTTFEEEDWLNKDLSRSFCAGDSANLDENWDLEEESQFEMTNFQTARSLEGSSAPETNEESAPDTTRDKTQSAPSSSNKLIDYLVVPGESGDAKEHPKQSKKCRIPRKTIGHGSVTGSVKETDVCEPFTIWQSHSLENVSGLAGFCPASRERSRSRNLGSFSPLRSRSPLNGSDGSLSDGTDDSGHPFSYPSPRGSTPEPFAGNDVREDVVSPFGKDEVMAVENGHFVSGRERRRLTSGNPQHGF